MRELKTDFLTSVNWITQGGVWDCGDEEQRLLDSVQRAHLIAVDPGDPCGVACFAYDLRAYGVTLHQTYPTVLAQALIHSFPEGCDLDLVCETPLLGSVRVFSSWPWRQRGFLELWHAAQHPKCEFVAAQVAWLKAGSTLAKLKRTTPPVSEHAKDALRYGVVALTQRPVLRTRLIEAAA